ncbi:uncharacterized protein LOC134283690 isoform X3 [Saccostrea cucullata]|uniref:uncharacterized protein LOC134283690 isoform X3 n=1 Tax=Saccostrea cuccullata TaxID=36930 RepID=UPI002ED5B5C6
MSEFEVKTAIPSTRDPGSDQREESTEEKLTFDISDLEGEGHQHKETVKGERKAFSFHSHIQCDGQNSNSAKDIETEKLIEHNNNQESKKVHECNFCKKNFQLK